MGVFLSHYRFTLYLYKVGSKYPTFTSWVQTRLEFRTRKTKRHPITKRFDVPISNRNGGHFRSVFERSRPFEIRTEKIAISLEHFILVNLFFIYKKTV